MPAQLSNKERRAILDKELRKFQRRGWILQSHSDTRGQLTRPPGCLGRLTFGIFGKGRMLIVEVNGRGKIRTRKRKQHV